MKEKIKKILIRSLHTFCQTMLGMLGTESLGLFDVNWKSMLSVCLMAALISILKSIVVGIPELQEENNYDNN